MPKLKNRTPKMCRHHKGQAFVWINGKQRWLGRWGSDDAREKYDRLVAEWLANGRQLPQDTAEPDDGPVSVARICVNFWKHVQKRQHPNEAANYKSAIAVVRKLYGRESAESFGPKRLRVVREQFIEKNWARSHINGQVSRVRSMFKWAVAQEMIPWGVYQRLRTLEPLRKGEAKREGRKVTPVPREYIRRVRPHLSRQVRGLIDLQLLTGARADELTGLRATDFNTSGPVWSVTYDGGADGADESRSHKTAHHGKERVVYFGPRAQRVLRQFMKPGRTLNRPLFSPRDAEAERYAACTVHRRKNQKPTARRTDRVVRDAYDTASYRRTIHRACKTIGIHNWSPHRLRHNAATAIRREFGVEAAQVILGHSNLKVTEIYAQANAEKAKAIIGKVG